LTARQMPQASKPKASARCFISSENVIPSCMMIQTYEKNLFPAIFLYPNRKPLKDQTIPVKNKNMN